MIRSNGRSMLACGALIALSTAAHAAPVTWQATGTVNGGATLNTNDGLLGTTAAGSVTYALTQTKLDGPADRIAVMAGWRMESDAAMEVVS